MKKAAKPNPFAKKGPGAPPEGEEVPMKMAMKGKAVKKGKKIPPGKGKKKK